MKEAYASIKAIAEDSEHGGEFIRRVFSSLIGQPVNHVVRIVDDSQLMKEQALDQRPDLKDIVTLVLPHIQERHWKRVGLALDIKKCTLDFLGRNS